MTKPRNRARFPWLDRLAADGRRMRARFRADRDLQVISGGSIGAAAIMGLLFVPQANFPPAPETWRTEDGRTLAPLKLVAEIAKPTGVVLVPGSASKLYYDFRRIGYKLEKVRIGAEVVPRVFVKTIPSGSGM